MAQPQFQINMNGNLNQKINTKLKLLVIGDLDAGKTSILRRYVYKQWDDTTESTIGMDIATKYVKVQEIKWSIQFWDIAGQERFIGLTRTYYKNALAAIVVFDITQRISLQNAKRWKQDVDDKVFLPNGDNIPAILLANKWDLIEDNPSLRKADDQELAEFCKENGFLGWFSTSAKTGKNVKKAMNFIIGETVNYVLKSEDGNMYDQGIDITGKFNNEHKNGKKKGKCANCAAISSRDDNVSY